MVFEIKNMTAELFEWFKAYYDLPNNLRWVDVDVDGALDLERELRTPCKRWIGCGSTNEDCFISGPLLQDVLIKIHEDHKLALWNSAGHFDKQAEAYLKLREQKCDTTDDASSCSVQLSDAVGEVLRVSNRRGAGILARLIAQYEDNDDPHHVLSTMYTESARLYRNLGHVDEARADFIRAVSLPSPKEAAQASTSKYWSEDIAYAADLLQDTAKEPEGVAKALEFLKALPKDFPVSLMDFVGTTYDVPIATRMAIVEGVLKRYPRSHDAYAARAYLYLTSEPPDFAKTEADYGQAITLAYAEYQKQGDNFTAINKVENYYKALLEILDIQQKYSEEEALIIGMGNAFPQLLPKAYSMLADLHHRLKQYDKELVVLNAKFQTNPDLETLLRAADLCLVDLQDNEKARAMFEHFLTTAPADDSRRKDVEGKLKKMPKVKAPPADVATPLDVESRPKPKKLKPARAAVAEEDTAF